MRRCFSLLSGPAYRHTKFGFSAGRGDNGSGDGTQFHIKGFYFKTLFIEELGWDTLREGHKKMLFLLLWTCIYLKRISFFEHSANVFLHLFAQGERFQYSAVQSSCAQKLSEPNQAACQCSSKPRCLYWSMLLQPEAIQHSFDPSTSTAASSPCSIIASSHCCASARLIRR